MSINRKTQTRQISAAIDEIEALMQARGGQWRGQGWPDHEIDAAFLTIAGHVSASVLAGATLSCGKPLEFTASLMANKIYRTARDFLEEQNQETKH